MKFNNDKSIEKFAIFPRVRHDEILLHVRARFFANRASRKMARGDLRGRMFPV